MIGIAEAIAAASTAALYDGARTEMFVAVVGEDGALQTLQFYETRATLGDVALLKSFDWRRWVPASATVLVPEGGLRPEEMKNFWVMWREGSRMMALSVAQPEPSGLEMRAGDRMIDRPLMVAGDQLHAYLWRGMELIRLVYRGGESMAVRAAVTSLGLFDAVPARNVCAPVPGDPSECCFLGGATEAAGGVVASGIYIRGEFSMHLDSPPLPGYRLFGRQRLGVHVGGSGQPAVGFMAENTQTGGYAALTAQFDFKAKGAEWSVLPVEGPEQGTLQSAGVFFRKSMEQAAKTFVMFVDRGGRLRLTSGGDVQLLRAGVGPEYSYPVLTTESSRYEVQSTGSGVRLQLF